MENPDVANPWRKSSRSSSNGGECVEVGKNPRNAVMVRDTKEEGHAARTVLSVTAGAWEAFTASLR